MRHVHRFEESERHFTGTWPAKTRNERLARGVTTIVLRCMDCGDLRVYEVLGDAKRYGED